MTRLLPLFVFLAVGCGPGTHVTGTIAGLALAPKAAISIVYGDAATSYGLTVALSDDPNLCADMSAGADPRGATTLLVGFNAADTTKLASAGTYPIDASRTQFGQPTSEGLFLSYDASCNTRLPASNDGFDAQLGTATLTRVSQSGNSATVAGTFDLKFNGDEVSGSFETVACQAPAITKLCQ